jgi:hypothetical protein
VTFIRPKLEYVLHEGQLAGNPFFFSFFFSFLVSFFFFFFLAKLSRPISRCVDSDIIG